MLAILASPFGRLIASLGLAAFAVAIAFGSGFVKGDKYRAGVDDAAGARAKIEWLQKQLDATNEARDRDSAQAKIDTDALTQRLEDATNAVAKISPGVCLDGADADGLRSLWPNANHGKH